jgi:CheY-like chemotaxis protein
MKKHIVFYCDDDEDDLLMFCDIMKEINPSLQCVTSIEYEEAMQKLSEGPIKPDIIFIDINMPKVSGIEMLAELKRSKEYSKTPIIMYTTSTHIHEIKQCLKLGANQVLTKLFDPQDTVRQLREAITTYIPETSKS